MTTLTFRILKCGEPTRTGKIYPRGVVRRALAQYDRADVRLGELVQAYTEGLIVNLSNVSHEIVDTYIDPDGWWVAEIKVLNTPMGNVLQMLIDAGRTPFLGPRGFGQISDDNRVTDYSLSTIDVLMQTPEL